MGLRTSPMSDVVLEDCFVPAEAMLGTARAEGGEIFQTSMRWERACIMASQVGVMRRTLERCVAYAKQRRQFGKPIGKFESVADKIADMKIAVDAARGLVLRVGWLMDRGSRRHDGCRGGEGVRERSERANAPRRRPDPRRLRLHDRVRDRARRFATRIGGTIYSGTSEIQRRIIARGLGL